ncbi:MAG: hypothetical protein ACOC1U_06745, partial [Spirochaetota bacterium]
RATTEIEGYEMSVTASGQIPNVEVNIVPSPALPTDEALVLLTTGTRTADLDFTSDVPGTLTAVGTVVGRNFLNRLSRAFAEEGQGIFERLDFEIERSRSSGAIGDIEVEYQLADGERWFLLFDRTADENYSVQLAWRIWAE